MDKSLSDFDSSSILLSDNDTPPSGTPTNLTPASKRKRNLLEGPDTPDENDELEMIDGSVSSDQFIRVEKMSPEPRRKNPTGLTPQKPASSVSERDTPSKVMEDFDNNLPETVCLLRGERGAKVYIVGTAHFSKESQEDVAKVIQAVKPHCVVVELCSNRTDIILCDEETVLAAAKDLNFQKMASILKKNGTIQGLMYLTLLSMSAHVTKQLGMAPGGEFRTAFNEAGKLPGCLVLLGDRPVNITVSRVLARLSWWQCAKLLWNLVYKENIRKEDVENAKKKDFLEAMVAEMAGEFPSLKEVFLTERDKFLTYSLQNAAGYVTPDHQPARVVGVVGIGHVSGIQENWGKVSAEDVQPLLIIPPKSLTSRIIRGSFKWAFIGGAAYAFYKFVPIPYSRIVQTVFKK